MQVAFATTLELDHKALVRVGAIYRHVIGQLTVVDLMDDPASDHPADRELAAERLQLLQGELGLEDLRDLEGRPVLMSVFLALSQVDPVLRRALNRMDLPKDREVSFESVDQMLTTAAESVLNTLATGVSGEGRGSRNAETALDRLTGVLGRIERDQHTQIEKQAGSLLGAGETRLKGWLQARSEKLVQWADARSQDLPANQVDNLAKGATALATLIDNSEKGELAAKALLMWNNQWKAPSVVKDLITEVIGTTDENEGVNLLVNKARYAVSRMRQEYRDQLPKIFENQFEGDVSGQDWSDLHQGLGRTAASNLLSSMAPRYIRQMYKSDAARKTEIAKARAKLTQVVGASRAGAYLQKTEELAGYMVTGEIAPGNHGFLRNTHAIARFLAPDAQSGEIAATRNALDKLVSLLAIDRLDPAVRGNVSRLAQDETAGFDFVLSYLSSLVTSETERLEATVQDPEIVRMNRDQGYIPAERKDGIRLIVARDSEHNGLRMQGYTRIKDYEGSGHERGKRGYYFSTVAGAATYNQGALQTVHASSFGVDPVTGMKLDGSAAGHVPSDDVERVRNSIQQSQQGQKNQGREVLVPVFDGALQVVGYERSMLPEMLVKARPNTHMGEMLGAWAGRQVEEQAAQDLNEVLVEELGKRWKADEKEGRGGEYVNLADPDLKDRQLEQLWGMVSRDPAWRGWRCAGTIAGSTCCPSETPSGDQGSPSGSKPRPRGCQG